MLTALVAMSGGVDSTVAARLAQVAGFSCEGALMKLYHTGTDGGANSNPNTTTNSKPNSKPNSKANTTTNTKPNTKTNTTPNGEADARAAAKQLGIPLHIYDFTENFAEHVIKRFIAAYREGRTPNPCVDCNKHLKFGLLLEKARELGMGCIVTGHYARIERAPGGRYLLKKGADASKDQSYVLYSLTQEQLSQTRFPLGGLTKTEVREIALAEGFQNAKKNESQDICFVPDGDYAGFIEDYTGEAPRRGRFVDKDGNDLGENKGVIHYTIGQRRGTGLALPYPPYVLEIRPENDTVVIGKNELLYSKTLYARGINLIAADKLDAPIRACVKIRYKHAAQPAKVRQDDDDTLHIEFDEPQRAITKGQAAVIYDGDTVIGGGTIM